MMGCPWSLGCVQLNCNELQVVLSMSGLWGVKGATVTEKKTKNKYYL